jgi:hypothetical protein
LFRVFDADPVQILSATEPLGAPPLPRYGLNARRNERGGVLRRAIARLDDVIFGRLKRPVPINFCCLDRDPVPAASIVLDPLLLLLRPAPLAGLRGFRHLFSFRFKASLFSSGFSTGSDVSFFPTKLIHWPRWTRGALPIPHLGLEYFD